MELMELVELVELVELMELMELMELVERNATCNLQNFELPTILPFAKAL